MPFGQLEINLWPAALALCAAACVIGAMLLADRLARRGAIKRTRRALQRVLNGSSVE